MASLREGSFTPLTIARQAIRLKRQHPHPLRLMSAPFSPGVFRMRAMLTCLWKGAKIRYNPAMTPDNAPWGLEAAFIHGAVFRRRWNLRHAAYPVYGDRPGVRAIR